MSSDRPAAPQRRAPRWLKLVNLLNRPLLRRGVGPAPQRLLSVPGSQSGIMRTTPVAVLESGGRQYIVAGYAGSDWVTNARHAGWAQLRGRRSQRVVLEEVPVAQRPPILRDFVRQVPGGRSFLLVGPGSTEEEFAAASPQHPVFRLLPAAD